MKNTFTSQYNQNNPSQGLELLVCTQQLSFNQTCKNIKLLFFAYSIIFYNSDFKRLYIRYHKLMSGI